MNVYTKDSSIWPIPIYIDTHYNRRFGQLRIARTIHFSYKNIIKIPYTRRVYIFETPFPFLLYKNKHRKIPSRKPRA